MAKQPDALYVISHEMAERLDNWGRAMRSNPRWEVSTTGKICDMLKKQARRRAAPEEAIFRERGAVDSRPPINQADAWAVNTAWVALPRQSDKGLLQFYYISNLRPERVASLLSFRTQEFAMRHRRAAQEIENILKKVNFSVDNVYTELYNSLNNSIGAPQMRPTI